MAVRTVTGILTNYFNVPTDTSVKKPAREWLEELKTLTDAEKLELAEGVAAITGDTIKA